VMADPATLSERHLGGAQVKVAIDLQRVAIHDLALEILGKIKCQGTFSRTGSSDYGNQRELPRVGTWRAVFGFRWH